MNPRQSRAAIGVMPQELNLDPFFTPRGALEVQAGLYGVPKSQRRSDEILRLVGLEDKAHAYARTLSGGMRRRLLLAKALVHHPAVLVLDEPTAGVDIELRRMLWDNVRRLNEEGMTIILTTHYLEEAEQMCDEIAIINHGELVARDTTGNLLGRLDAKTLVIRPDAPVTHLPQAEGIEVETRPHGELAITYQSGRTSCRAGARSGPRRRHPHLGRPHRAGRSRGCLPRPHPQHLRAASAPRGFPASVRSVPAARPPRRGNCRSSRSLPREWASCIEFTIRPTTRFTTAKVVTRMNGTKKAQACG